MNMLNQTENISSVQKLPRAPPTQVSNTQKMDKRKIETTIERRNKNPSHAKQKEQKKAPDAAIGD